MATNRPRRSGNRVTTRSGRVIKTNQSLSSRLTAMKEAKALRKAERLRGLPKSRFKRILWRLNPKHLANYWFSRDGGIMALKILGIVILAMFVFTLGVFAYFRKDLPDISVNGSNIGGSISYYDRTGTVLLWQDNSGVKRVPIQGSEMNQYIKDATVSVEDRDFYNHRGFDVKGIARAAYNDALHKGGTQGGSTITQQLVKLNLDWTQQRTISRKVKELILAVELERTYTKDDILTGYLNTAPYGGVDYGVQAAASDYFHKNAKDLTLAESAFLAAIPKSPSYYSPYSSNFDKTAFTNRYDYVLDSMVQTHKITQAQANDAKKVDILAEVQPQQTKYAGIRAPYFVLAAKDELEKRFINCSASDSAGCSKIGGWKVITTLDMNMQKTSEDRVAANLPNLKRNGGDEEATVTEDVQTGQMLALVGGTDFDDPDHGHINYAQWPISPGSSIKPYDYSALIDNNNAGAGSVLYDVVGPVPGYPCTNRALPPNGNCLWDFDRKSPGPMTIRYALGGSRNIPAVKATVSIVPNNVQASINKRDQYADDMMDGDVGYHCYKDGVDVTTATTADQVPCYPSSAIGDGAYLHLDQHLNGLSTLGRLGQAIPATYILKLYDATSTKPFYSWTQPKPKQVMKTQTAYIMDNMLSDPNASYFGSSTKFQHYKGWDIAVKTGTTNDNYDGLMMAWTTKYAVGTWVGYHTRTKALSGAMENLTMPVTRNVIESALDSLHTTPVNWQQPAGIQTLTAFHSSIAYSSQVGVPNTDIFPSWYKPKSATAQNVSIDKVSNKIATSCTPPLAVQKAGGSAAANSFSIDPFYPPGAGSSSSGSTTTPADTDDVHSCSDSPPSITLTVTDNGTPPAGSSGDTCTGSCTLTAAISQGTHPFDDSKYPQFPGTVTFSVNGQVVKTINTSSGGPYSFVYSPTDSGAVTVSAQVVDSVLYSATDSATVSMSTNGLGFRSGPPGVTQNDSNQLVSYQPRKRQHRTTTFF